MYLNRMCALRMWAFAKNIFILACANKYGVTYGVNVNFLYCKQHSTAMMCGLWITKTASPTSHVSQALI
jgi:hypothetical protein